MDPHDWHDLQDMDDVDSTEFNDRAVRTREKLRSLVYGY